ncbi:MAG TPA: PEGA domain-containing protein [Kofleriaceae bacterium]|nr:PEGA domain-containing protein [Kofleriaceae bacterium]
MEPVELARITITSEPSGAEVFDESGRKLGETPTEFGVPADGSEHTLTLRHPRAKERTKVIAATGDMTVSVILEEVSRKPGTGSGTGTGTGSGKGTGTGKGTGKGKAGEGTAKPDIMEPAF